MFLRLQLATVLVLFMVTGVPFTHADQVTPPATTPAPVLAPEVQAPARWTQAMETAMKQPAQPDTLTLGDWAMIFGGIALFLSLFRVAALIRRPNRVQLNNHQSQNLLFPRRK